MEISYYFKNLDPTEAIKSYVAEKMAKLDNRFHHVEGTDARFAVERQNQIFELTVHADSRVFHIKKTEKDMYASIDSCIDSLQKQLDRHHKKITGRDTAVPEELIPSFSTPEIEEESTITVYEALAKPMDDKEAILQLQAQTFRFLMFHQAGEKRYSLLYVRPDANYGIVKPAAEARQYEEHVYQQDGSELHSVSVALYPMSRFSISDAVDRLDQSRLEFLSFVNEDTGRMNLLFHGSHGELILQRPAI